jgi:hypothetical protein
LQTQVKTVEQWLLVMAAQLGSLWKTVAGMGRPMSSDTQLTAMGNEMTMEKHVAIAETHLRYVEGHLQPSEEHLADAKVHLKLVRAHLAAIEPLEKAEMDQTKEVPPPAQEAPLPKAQVVLPPQEDERWTCPVRECREEAAHPQNECDEFGKLSVARKEVSSGGSRSL